VEIAAKALADDNDENLAFWGMSRFSCDENGTVPSAEAGDGTMRLCSECGAVAADFQDTCGVCGAPIGGVAIVCLSLESPAEATIVESPPFPARPLPAPVGVPRRFSIGTMMILTTAFAVLFGVLKTIGVDPGTFAAISLFIGGVAACQSLLFKGKMPRLASFVGGILLCFLIGATGTALDYLPSQGHYHIITLVGSLIGVGIGAMICGGPLGYIVGCFVAAIFLVRKEPDDAAPTPDKSVEQAL
jgi:hypothetical protein